MSLTREQNHKRKWIWFSQFVQPVRSSRRNVCRTAPICIDNRQQKKKLICKIKDTRKIKQSITEPDLQTNHIFGHNIHIYI